MGNINVVNDIRSKFSDYLKEVMEEKNLFHNLVHDYLTDVMMRYVSWEEHPLLPSVNTRNTAPFIFQINGIGERPEYVLEKAGRYSRLKSVAETLLFAVGYWPESISSVILLEETTGKKIVIKDRPPISYYASKGSEAYGRAYNIDSKEIMIRMARDFNKYAGVLHNLRNRIGDIPITDINVIGEVSCFLGDQSTIERYLLSQK